MFGEYVSRTVEIRQAKSGEPANCRWAPQASQHNLRREAAGPGENGLWAPLQGESPCRADRVPAGGDLVALGAGWRPIDAQPWWIDCN